MSVVVGGQNAFCYHFFQVLEASDSDSDADESGSSSPPPRRSGPFRGVKPPAGRLPTHKV